MKKDKLIFYVLFSLIFVLDLFVLVGCSKNDEISDCNCDPKSTQVTLKIGNQKFSASLYDYEESPYKFWSIKNENIDDFYHSFATDNNQITSVFLFTNSVDNKTLDINDVTGYVTLKKDKDKRNKPKYNINIFKRHTGQGYTKVNQEELESYYLSFNDISNVNNLYFETSKNIIYIKNPNRQFKGTLMKSTFQNEINEQLKLKGLLNKTGGEICASPCPSHEGYCYEGMDPQHEYQEVCYGKCLKNEVDDEHDGNDPSRPVSSVVLSPASYSFRDDYLY